MYGGERAISHSHQKSLRQIELAAGQSGDWPDERLEQKSETKTAQTSDTDTSLHVLVQCRPHSSKQVWSLLYRRLRQITFFSGVIRRYAKSGQLNAIEQVISREFVRALGADLTIRIFLYRLLDCLHDWGLVVRA